MRRGFIGSVNSQSPPAAAFDLTAFEAPLDRAASREFFAMEESGAASAEEHIMVRHRTFRIAAVVALVAIAAGLALWWWEVDIGEERLVPTLIGGGLLTLITSAVVLKRSGAPRAYQISQFAHANDFSFDRLMDSAGYEGMPFRYGREHRRWMVVSGVIGGRPVEFGNLAFVEPTTMKNIPRRCGYIAIRLPARLPQMVLNSGHSSILFGFTLPEPPHRDHELDVGAGRAFRLCTAQYGEHIAQARHACAAEGLPPATA